MNIPSPRASRRARIEIIPLIDIIFFLLATFIMVSLSMIQDHGIPVNLPVASTGSPQERQDYASVSITVDSRYLFNKEPVSKEQLIDRLAELKTNDPEARVYINADAKAEFGLAVSILDEARKMGIAKIAIETRPK
jgi:biopolymer transport protein ExbD